ncbi:MULTISPECIES: FAD synthetase family protein [Priestia]|uniref:FAD synthetase family protein n=1 Tax=Priestia TaxID=2800373 RepID=UPI001ADB480B|nr:MULTISPECIES: FAD synthetase family protein [Priestia]MDN3233166.1 FAD synthetase family protein [Priestia megaterium]QTL52354.1 FAD synthetase family protein [Priestia aryabhattai]
MKTFYINNQNRKILLNQFSPCVVALGFFDGVHLGHQEVIKTAVKIAKHRNVQAAVMTFSPHPKEVINKQKVDYLTSLDVKKNLFQKLGIEVLYLIHFDSEFATLSSKEFAQSYLIDFQIEHVVAGFDFTYGFRGKGNMRTIVADGLGKYTATTIDQFHFQGEKISSTRIRSIIQEGNVGFLPHLLGDFYKTNGVVKKRKSWKNRDNIYQIYTDEYCLLPKPGTYQVIIRTEKDTFEATIHRYEEKENIVYMIPYESQFLEYKQRINIEWIKCWSIKRKTASASGMS